MAKAHGLEEFEKTLEESIRSMDPGEIDPDQIIQESDNYARKGKALLPLRPLYMENETYCKKHLNNSLNIYSEQRDWPMINLRAKEAERAAKVFQKRRDPELADNDDMFFDA